VTSEPLPQGHEEGNGQAVGVQLDSISREVFPLPTPGLELERLAGDVAHGRGFALVQGVPVDGLTEQQCALVSQGRLTRMFGGPR
jgi:hypothetical protein